MESCQCSCLADGDYDSPEFVNERVVKARKTHICCECRSKIEPGEQYECTSGKWDGCMKTFKTCFLCFRIREDLCSCGFIYGGLQEQIYEDLGFDYITGYSPYDEDEEE